MFDLDSWQEILQQLSVDHLPLDQLSLDQLADVMAEAGIDVSQLTEQDINALAAAAGHGFGTSLQAAEAPAAVHTHGDALRFGGLTHVEPLADRQIGPTCSHETIENLVQLAAPGIANNYSEHLAQWTQGQPLDPGYWKGLLQGVGVSAEWYWFDHKTLVSALDLNHGVAIVGDAHYLDPVSYPAQRSLHAITLTDVWRDQAGNVLGYKGIDSNFPGQEMRWPLQAVQLANEHGTAWANKAFITSVPVAWPFKTT